MRMGLCGAHRVGKSTTASEYADATGIKFLKTSTADVLKRIGFNAKDQYSIHQRLFAQEMVLDYLIEQWASTDSFVTDRTPFDVLAYMEADVLRDFPDELAPRLAAYKSKIYDAMKYFDYIVLIQPGIEIVDDAKSAPPSVPYIEHLNNLLISYTIQNGTHTMPRFMTDLQARVDFLVNIDKAKRPRAA